MLLNCIPVDDPEQRPHTLILRRASSVGKWGQRLLQEAVCVCVYDQRTPGQDTEGHLFLFTVQEITHGVIYKLYPLLENS